VLLVPLTSTNQLVVFAQTSQIIDHVKAWVGRIDRRHQLSIDSGIFSYAVKNTQAEHIVELLEKLDEGNTGDDEKGNRVGQFVVDTNRNAVVYKGSGQSWLELQPVIYEMDKTAPSVLVEVLLAEITLNEGEQTGLEFLAKGSQSINGKSYGTLLSTLGGLGVGESGLSATLDSAGETRAVLNLFYENSRAEIRSRPRLMVKSGENAIIDVGTEIPIITSNAQSTDVTSSVIQSIQYRKTGVRLNIKPVVHASGHVDIAIEQELSEAQVNQTSGIDSPSIFNRTLQTTVTLQDGGSILLGGLISKSATKGNVGVPVLGKIPYLGRLFRSDSVSDARTELVVMVIPYVINNQEEARAISSQISDNLLSP
jgi:general secretion pathway protein D